MWRNEIGGEGGDGVEEGAVDGGGGSQSKEANGEKDRWFSMIDIAYNRDGGNDGFVGDVNQSVGMQQVKSQLNLGQSAEHGNELPDEEMDEWKVHKNVKKSGLKLFVVQIV